MTRPGDPVAGKSRRSERDGMIEVDVAVVNAIT